MFGGLIFEADMKLSAVLFVAFIFAMSRAFMLAQTPASPSPSTNSGIEGVISIGPTHGGPARVGVPSSRPLANTDFIAVGEKEMHASFKTDERGQFRVLLPPGHYKVAKKEKSRIGSCGLFEVDVSAGQMTKVEWYCDSGMR